MMMVRMERMMMILILMIDDLDDDDNKHDCHHAEITIHRSAHIELHNLHHSLSSFPFNYITSYRTSCHASYHTSHHIIIHHIIIPSYHHTSSSHLIIISHIIGSTSVSAYFPTGYWYDFQSRKLTIDSSSTTQTVTLPTPLTAVNVHVHGGSILPLQQAAMTTTLGRATPFTLLVALCPGGKAFGNLFWDDGEQLSLDHFLYLSFEAHLNYNNDDTSTTATMNTLTSTVFTNTLTHTAATSMQLLQTITILGNSNQIRQSSSSTTKGVTINKQQLLSDQVVYDETKNSLSFINLNIPMTDDILISWGN
jgi:hypothetical protein